MYSLEPNALFACLDGSKSIPATSINDDFCDCYDGSDEPGTSACNDTFFYCNNAGHIGSFIPSSRVNDGICDPECCDGSDEYLGIIKCPDVCAKVGAEFKKAELEKQRVLQKGIKVKKEYLTYAINAKHVRAKQIIDLEVDIWNITSRIEELKVIRNEAEAYENHVNALMAQQSLEEAQAVMPQQLAECTQRKNVLRSNIDTLNSRINELQSILDNLMKLKDAEEGAAFEALLRDKPILKETLQQYDDFKRNLEDGRGAIALEAEPEVSIIDESATGGVDRATLTDPCIDPTASTVRCVLGSARGLLLGSYGAIKYPFVWPGWRKLYSSLRNPFIRLSRSEENELLRKDASKARSHLLDAENKKRDLETKIADLKKKSELDMGPNNVWDKLVGTCFEIKSFEYFYEICILDKAVQRPINGGSSTDLGKFSRWGSRKDDKMTESTGKYLFMMFENGAHCWNGPHRSVEVAFECGSENKVMSVAEPSKCEYAMRVQTPAVCEESADTYHNEL
ncbi:glucosidase II beta subunit-like-domain-containing protein [Obelidium mucronatum]|nr:glucosidase II beta subunit-like-domain-containing protein [Obelidium mucronatum]